MLLCDGIFQAHSLTKLYTDFIQDSAQVKISYSTYRRIFRVLRITFGNPKQDSCEQCIRYSIHKQRKHMPGEPTCLECGKYGIHQKNAVVARALYKADVKKASKERDTGIYAVDMQRVLLLPIMTAKSAFFTSKLV